MDQLNFSRWRTDFSIEWQAYKFEQGALSERIIEQVSNIIELPDEVAFEYIDRMKHFFDLAEKNITNIEIMDIDTVSKARMLSLQITALKAVTTYSRDILQKKYFGFTDVNAAIEARVMSIIKKRNQSFELKSLKA